jgi:hypothetical protein
VIGNVFTRFLDPLALCRADQKLQVRSSIVRKDGRECDHAIRKSEQEEKGEEGGEGGRKVASPVVHPLRLCTK